MSVPDKLTVLIIEDENVAREGLKKLLLSDPQIALVQELSSGYDAVEKINLWKPDIIFIDIQLPGKTGLEILEELHKENFPVIVFVTAYDHYALSAFEFNAIDYLLKPFEDERFRRSIEKAKNICRQKSGYNLHEKITLLQHAASAKEKYLQQIVIKEIGEITFLKVDQIDYIEAYDYYSCIYVGTKRHLLRQPMKELESKLDPAAFVRIHRSTILNIRCIESIMVPAPGEYEVKTNLGKNFKMSKKRVDEIKTVLGIRKKTDQSSRT